MGKSSQTTNEATKTEIDPQLKDMYMTNYANAQRVGEGMSSMGPYTGTRVAGPTEALQRSADITANSAAAMSGEVPPWAAGQSIKRAEGWLNDVHSMSRGDEGTQMQAYGYDPLPFWTRGATVDPSQSETYSMDRSGIRDMMTGSTPREAIRDVNAPDTPRELIRDVNNPNFDRSLIRDVNNPNVDRSLVRDVSIKPVPRELVRDVSAGTIASGMPTYTNAYTDGVINRGLLDLNRARQLTQQQNGASAIRAGAFGGARHGVMEGETNRGFADASARLAAEERSKAFAQSASLSQADQASRMQAALANQGQDATMADLRLRAATAEGTANQGADLTMAGLRQQAGLETGRMNQAADLTAAQLRQEGMLRAGTANQAADMTAAQLRQQAGLEAGKANQAADLSAADMYQRGVLQAGAANQNMDYQTALASLNALNSGGQFNAGQRQQANMASAGYAQQAAQNNQAAANDASRFNATQKQAASAANQAGRFQSISQMLQAAQQAQALAQMQYQLPMDAASRLMNLDQYSRGVTNEQLQAAMQAWDDERYRNLPAMQLASSALGMQLPNLGMSSTGNSKTTYSPSGLQTIGQIAGLAGMFMR